MSLSRRAEILAFVKVSPALRRDPPPAATAAESSDSLSARSLFEITVFSCVHGQTFSQSPSHASHRRPFAISRHSYRKLPRTRRSSRLERTRVSRPPEREGSDEGRGEERRGQRGEESRAHLRRTPGPRCTPSRGGWQPRSSTRRSRLEARTEEGRGGYRVSWVLNWGRVQWHRPMARLGQTFDGR